jgi:hypothetical protein
MQGPVAGTDEGDGALPGYLPPARRRPPCWQVKANPCPGNSQASAKADRGWGGGGGNCHPSYSVWIMPPPPDLDCDDVNATNFQVTGSDPHGFDGDNDGIGCET